MIINLIKPQELFTLILPEKIKGQYWVTDIGDNNKVRNLISVEAVDGEWILKSNKNAAVLDSKNKPVAAAVLNPMSFLNIRIISSNEIVTLFAEEIDDTRQKFRKMVVTKPAAFNIGRNADNNICYGNKYVSGKHARLIFDGNSWTVQSLSNTNGTYVNGLRTESQNLVAGDLIYIMGLKIVLGHGFFAINNPDGMVKINSESLIDYVPQEINTNYEIQDLPEKKFFYRSPRFRREIQHDQITIDPPPQREKDDSTPLALMLGPSITMGITSMSTGVFSVMNVLNNGGEIMQAMPTLLMSVSMLLGTVLWPIVTKKFEKRKKIKTEQKRQDKYLEYLDEVRDEIKRKCKEQSDILFDNLVSPDECIARIAEERTNLWERVIGQSDFLKLRLGIGNLPLDASVSYQDKKFSMDEDNLQDAMLSLGTESKELRNVPVSFSLVEDRVVGVYGSYIHSCNLVKSLILQMIALHSYDELKLALIVDKEDENNWEFTRFIPHFWNDDKTARFLATNTDEVKELSSYLEKSVVSRGDNSTNDDYSAFSPYFVIMSASRNLSEKCEALQQLLKFKNNKGFSVVFLEQNLNDLPKEANMVIHANGSESVMLDRNDTSGKVTQFSADVVNEAAIDTLAGDIANIELDSSSQRYSLPNMITFLEMFNVSKIEHLNPLTRWKENNPTITLQAPIGVDVSGGTFNLDLHEKFHGPHGLVAGMTGSGKSEFIITYILSLAVNYHPDEVAFILIDYKGGGLTGAFEDEERGIKLPHLAGTITNLDGAAVKRSLISIQSELRRRQAIFNEARKISNEGTMDIYKYQQLFRDKVVKEPVPHLFIISDEFAELKTQQPEFMEQLISAARIGRSLGVHLILATQKPSGVVDDQIWSNSKFRVCLKVQEKADSQDMIKCPDAAELSQTGRFYLQVGFNELFALGQSAWCGAEYIPTETVEKTIDSSVRIVDNLGRTIMTVKPEKKKIKTDKKVKQIVSIVKYLSDLAIEENITVRPLWLKPIPEFIFVDEIEEKYNVVNESNYLNPVIGEYDDPFNQRQDVLRLPLSNEGNCLVYGSTGNGKATFLMTLCYSLIKNYSADKLNVYIMDFGSETLKAFENAPQVGGVVLSSDEEKTLNLLKMIYKEIESRRALFSSYGGDYFSYLKNSGKSLPQIVVMLNNFAGFAEQFEDLTESFSLLTRDGSKYGVYFVVTASSTNAVRYRTQQNFKMIMTMQLNDTSEYSVLLGKTDGLVPTKYKGRGLVKLDRVYEFQTACCSDAEDKQEFIRNYCKQLRSDAKEFAKRIPVLPDRVNYQIVEDYVSDYSSVPVGVDKKSLQIATLNFKNKLVYPFVSSDIVQMQSFVTEFVKVASSISKVTVIDAEKVLDVAENDRITVVADGYEKLVLELFDEMVYRNNHFKDENMNPAVLDEYEEKLIVIFGMKRLNDLISEDAQEKLSVLLDKGEAEYKLHFIIAEALTKFNGFGFAPWFKRNISGTEGLWIGDGIAEQYMLKLNKISSELYDDIGDEYGYVVDKGRPKLVKLLTCEEEEGTF